MRTAKTLIRLGGCPGWSESSLGAHSFCLFCHVAAHIYKPRINTEMKRRWGLCSKTNTEKNYFKTYTYACTQASKVKIPKYHKGHKGSCVCLKAMRTTSLSKSETYVVPLYYKFSILWYHKIEFLWYHKIKYDFVISQIWFCDIVILQNQNSCLISQSRFCDIT